MWRRFFQVISGVVGIFLLAIVILYFPLPAHSFFWDRTFDTGHIFVFGFGVFLLLSMLLALLNNKLVAWQYGFAIVGGLSVGIFLEIWQASHGRSSELIDVFCDLVGLIAFSALFACIDSRLDPRSGLTKRWRLVLLATVVLLTGIVPYLIDINEYRVRKKVVPQLVDFSRPWLRKFYYSNNAEFAKVAPPDDWPSPRPQMVGRIKTKSDRFPAFVMTEPFPDWTGYRQLEVEIYFAESQLHPFGVRVHDAFSNRKYKDRFNWEESLQPGFQTIRIDLADVAKGPRNRELDLSKIAGMAVFMVKPNREMTFYVGQIRLLK